MTAPPICSDGRFKCYFPSACIPDVDERYLDFSSPKYLALLVPQGAGHR